VQYRPDRASAEHGRLYKSIILVKEKAYILTVLSARKQGSLLGQYIIPIGARSTWPYPEWIAFAALWRLVVAFVVGKRSQASANLLLERGAHVTTEQIPCFTSDQLAEYRTALLHVYGEW
jgi:hypothetical protein